MEDLKRILEWESQYCSLELSQKLFDLGAPTETCFLWVWNNEEHPKHGWSLFANSPYTQRNLRWDKTLPAYSCAELGEMLPKHMDNFFLRMIPCEEGWHICYWNCSNGKYDVEAETEADARATMLIYLIENKLIEIPQ